ncbi:MAG: cation-translocating P-type ATPase [Leptolinea sp.]|jgi:Ca2+-transporting ATPase|nr:cation-translocating P-type ATPase [Leptolinea sp.]
MGKEKEDQVIKKEKFPSYSTATIDEALKSLDVSLENGLSSSEVSARIEKYGPNQLQEAPKRTFLEMVIDQLKSFVIILLLVAAAISGILGEWVDAIAILLIVVLNAVMGVVQESRAEEALASLKKMASPEAHVIRDGKRITIPASQLVPGDVVFLEAGNFIPADIRLTEAVNLRVEEAALTGESLPIQKNSSLVLKGKVPLGDMANCAFMGTMVSYGRGMGVVTSTGMSTELGQIATMLQEVENEETPLQKKLDDLGKTLGYACIAVCVLVFVTGMIRATDLLDPQHWVDQFMIAVSLAIAAVPEGLPAIVTISLALGMREMVNRHALIRRLSSVETLGSATVICTDKTGTLTQNEMTVTRLWVDGKTFEVTGSGYATEGKFLLDGKEADLEKYPGATTALWVGMLNNDAHLEVADQENEKGVRVIGDPTEASLLVAAAKAGAELKKVNHAFPRTAEIPFDSERKRMVTLHDAMQATADDFSPYYHPSSGERYVAVVKGAPDIVLSLCKNIQCMDDKSTKPMDEAMKAKVLEANDSMTKDALRVLGLAFRTVDAHPDEENLKALEEDLTFVGLIGMIDPPRPEVKPALLKARHAGIRTVMITGDYPNTARAIGESIGLIQPGHSVFTGAQINDLSDEELQKAAETTDVYARVSPEHKMRIVDALRGNKQIVAMTGDGVNDAPAIKRADIGVAMGITGTDVAKQTADMVLTDDNYASIVSAVEQGRVIYSNIRKFVYFLISCNLAEILIIFLPTLFGRGSPLTAIQLLWLNLISDGAPALALGTEKGDPDLMDRKPRPPEEPIINKKMAIGVAIQTVVDTATTLTAFNIGLRMGAEAPNNIAMAETMAFVTLCLSELIRAYAARSERYSTFKIGFFSNKWMNLAVLSSFLLVMMVVYVPFFNPIFNTQPLELVEWAEVIPLFIVPFIAAELIKVFVFRGKKSQ